MRIGHLRLHCSSKKTRAGNGAKIGTDLDSSVVLLIALACAAASAQPGSGQGGADRASFAAPGSAVVLARNDALPDAPGEETLLAAPMLPMAAAMAGAGGSEAFEIEPTVVVHQDPFSRMAMGVAISPLGVGINAALLLTGNVDARLSGNYFAYNNGRIEVDEFNVSGGLHLGSASASLDFYPFNSPIRLSAGLMFLNDNHASATLRIAAGSNFTFDGETFFAGGQSPGSSPLTGRGELAFHSIRPAPTLTFGFGKFIPRSDRHWSFPSEFGVAFTGAPTISVAMAGTVCTDRQVTCSDLSDPSNPVTIAFNSHLQAEEAQWRHSLSRIRVFPIAAGGVSYSFGTPWRWTPRAKF